MKFPSSLRLSALALVSSLALTGCIDSGGGESDAEDDDTIRIGISLPLTGDYAEPGKGIQRGYEAWPRGPTRTAACSASRWSWRSWTTSPAPSGSRRTTSG